LIYVSVVTALSATDALGSRPSEAVEALSFACNTSWVDCHHGPFNHFWSLAVEEQFYLFWPLLLILSHGRYRVAIVLATLVVSTITSPIDSLRVHGWLSNGLAVACLAAGALYALSYRFRSAFAPLSRIPTAVFIGLVCLVVPFVLTRWGGAQVATLRLLPFLIVAAVLARSGSVTRFIGLGRILNRVGLVSYSLYLWHALSALRPEFYLSPAFVWTAWLAIPLAWISYRFVELPFIKIGQLLEARFRSWSLAPTFS
jgi:peptidoglycan/LPS O-acetylase OafA/YrhL